jgi:hypothetical protein
LSNAKHRTTECPEETRVKVINPPELYHSQYLGPGDLEVQLATLIDVTTDESLPIGHLGKNRLSVNLRATPPLRVHFVLIRYTATAAAYPDPQTYVASDLDLRLINSWLARAYPIAGVSSTNVIVDSNYTVPFDCNKTKRSSMCRCRGRAMQPSSRR